MKKILINKLNLNLLSISLLITLIIPLNLAKSSNQSYDIKLCISLLFISLILFALLTSFSILINKISSKSKFYKNYSSVINFILIWIFFTGVFFPISGLSGQFLNLDLPIRLRFIILLKIFLILLIFIFLEKKDKNNFFLKFIFCFTIINLILIIINAKGIEIKNHKNSLSNFGKKNLIVLSFDGISGHKIYKEILRNKEFKKTLKDFKLFKNTITGAPFTGPSINIEIHGEYKSEKFLNILNNKNIDIQVYNTYAGVLENKKNAVYRGQYQNYNFSFTINNFLQTFWIGSVSRWASPISVIILKPLFDKKIYKSFVNFVAFDPSKKSNPFNQINKHDKVDLYEYDLIFDNITYKENLKNVIRMYHFTFSHWPILINENCEEVKSFKNSIQSFQEEEIMLMCISKKINKFIKKLQENNIYNNSMIVIKSDHAKPNCSETHHTKYRISEFFKPRQCSKHYNEYPYTEKLNNHFYYGLGRYKSFILIKDNNQISDEIVISDKQVFLHDLSLTYCSFFSDIADCNISNRNNLTVDEDQFKVNTYDIYITKPQFPLSTTNFSKLDKYQMPSNIKFFDFLKLKKIIQSN